MSIGASKDVSEVIQDYVVVWDAKAAQSLVLRVEGAAQKIIGVVTSPNIVWDQRVYYINKSGTVTRADISTKGNPTKYVGWDWIATDTSTPIQISRALSQVNSANDVSSELAA